MDEPIWLKHYPKAVPASIQIPKVSIQQFLADAARDFPNRVCLSHDERKITYQDLETQTSVVAGNLIGLGVKPGDRVGLLLPNIPEFVLSFFAILKAGAIVAAFNPAYLPGELAILAQDAGIGIMITNAKGYESWKQAVGGLRTGRAIVLGEAVSLRKGDIPFSALRIDNDFVLPQVSYDDPVIYQYSGGTTGLPKGVIATHYNLVANTIQFQKWLWTCRRGEETILAAIPLYHVYGMVLAMCLGMTLAATLELVPDPRDLAVFQVIIQRSKPTIFPAVPVILGWLAHLPADAPGVNELKGIKAIISGASSLPAGVRMRFEKLTGVTIMEGYGLSEAPTATHCNPLDGLNKPGTIGIPLPDVEARIVSLKDEITPLPVGEPGELVIRAPQVMKGYLNRPDETDKALRDYWLYTGDIAVMDADGYFKLIDRKKDMIKSGGLQVWPREVEEILIQHPSVADAGVAGVADDLRGEAVAAWIVLKKGMDLSSDELRNWCKQHMAGFKIPLRITFVSSLPRSSVGKLLRRELKQSYDPRLLGR